MAIGEGKRICLWSFWVANLLVDAVYVVMCLATADNLSRASGNLHIANGWKGVGQTAQAFISNNIWRAPVAACALAAVMVLLFNIMSCAMLVRRSMVRSAPGFGYGWVLAWAFVLSFQSLMVGLILEGFDNVVTTELEKTQDWTTLATGAFRAAYGLSYVVAVLFALFFIVLLVFQGAVTRELGIADAMRSPARAAEMGALAAAGHAPI